MESERGREEGSKREGGGGGREHSYPFALTSRLYLLHSILRIIVRYQTIAAIVVRVVD